MSSGNPPNPYGYEPQASQADAPVNPFAPTSQLGESIVAVDSDAHQIRRQHIAHEASIKSIGVLYFLGAIVFIPMGAFAAAGTFMARGGPAPIELGVIGLVYLGLGVLWIWLGLGLRRLSPAARIVASIFSALGLLGFPVGTIINGYILYLLLSAKGRTIFAPEYQEVIRLTPDVKYHTSKVVIALLIIIVLLMIFGVGALFVGG
ncbi:hypothetical protein [Aporhodopirellula aestuarii]|uniref:Yip1 domain-containing protein n=1 Tax=Aporhodopirellula aestuarii TaxID=2950107 RepID=A0ABT0U717_9BACT|nr:hypothetical protein [Aporhodopirellula aestuarii]MCM2372693.1 hypothetical protein [Aporhodopirellula aestuarii]